MRFTTSFALASGLIVGGTLSAGAWPAVTTTNTNLRGGPGVHYGVLGTLPAGSAVEVVACTGSWCQTQYGYVSARLLSQSGGYAPMAGYAASTGYAPAYANSGTNYRLPYNTMAAPAAPVYAPPASSVTAGAAVLGYGAPPVSTPAPVANRVVATNMGVTGGTAANGVDPVHPGSNTTMAGPRTTIGTTNVRSGPGVEYDIIKTLPDFTKVEVTGCANSWCQTNEGYISIYLLSRGPVQQVLSAQAQPRVPGSQTRDSLAWNAATQAAMGYGAPGAAVQGYAAPAGVGTYPSAGASALGYAPARTYPAPGRAYAPSNVAGAYAATGTATTRTNVNVRSGPGVRYALLGTLPAGSPVSVVGCTGSWCQTQYGYVSARHIDQGGYGYTQPAYPAAYRAAPTARGYYPVGTNIGTVPVAPAQAPRYLGAPGAALNPAPTAPGFATSGAYTATTSTDVNVRSGPGTGYQVLGALPAGAPVSVVGCSGSWCETQYGYVSARYLSSGRTDAGSLLARPAVVSGAEYSSADYVDPAMLAASPSYAPASSYDDLGYVEPVYPQGGYVTAASLPVQDTLGGLDSSWGGYGRGIGWTNWRTSWGPGYWGPALSGRNMTSNWGARPSYWGGRTSFWNIHPGYPTRARFGDRRGNMYWSKRGEGRLPQSAAWYLGMGPRWQGPYAEGPEYRGRPVVWRPRAGIW